MTLAPVNLLSYLSTHVTIINAAKEKRSSSVSQLTDTMGHFSNGIFSVHVERLVISVDLCRQVDDHTCIRTTSLTHAIPRSNNSCDRCEMLWSV